MSHPEQASVVIAGGGVAALEAALTLRELGEERVSVEIVAPEPHFWYRPLAVIEPFGLGEVVHLELAALASAAGASFTLGTVDLVDVRRHVVHTSADAVIPYDFLLIAGGAVPRPAVRGALTFRGPADTAKIKELLAEIGAGTVRRVAFVVPWGALWVLPIYELALLTARHVAARGLPGIELTLVTPEAAPLHLFGEAASEAVAHLLAEQGVSVHTRAYPIEFSSGELRIFPDTTIATDRVVALPRLQGIRIDGIPQTVSGFIPVDAHGKVIGLPDGRMIGVPDVYAAGDITSFPIKQGGIATQQADAAAESIAAAAGADLIPSPFEPVLRGMLLTGSAPHYFRRELEAGDEHSSASVEPLWWPPAKIVGRRLASFLAEQVGAQIPSEPPASADAVPIEVALGAHDVDRLTTHPFGLSASSAAAASTGEDTPPTVAEVMLEPVVVAPEDTIGEVAETMLYHDVSAALVSEFGRLVGIVTAADLLRALAGRVHSSEARVRAWMTVEPVSVSSEVTLDAAALLMTEHRIHQLPVVDGEQPVGLVGLGDVARTGPSARLSGVGLGY